ncbi:hypothetical protein FD754_021304, partial [Muntiacus muntjak]
MAPDSELYDWRDRSDIKKMLPANASSLRIAYHYDVITANLYILGCFKSCLLSWNIYSFIYSCLLNAHFMPNIYRSWESILTVVLVVTLQSNKVPVVQPSHAVHPLTPLITYSDEHFSPGSHPSHIPSDVNSKQGMSRHPPAPEIPTFYPLSPGGVGQITPPLGWQGQPVYPITGGFRQPYPSSLSVDTSMSRFSHHMIPGPPGPHTTGIPHPAIVTPQVKQEHPHADSDLMHVKPQHEQRKEQEPKRPHIKKPLNAFMLYMKEMRANVVAECTLKESAAINQILGRRWHALSREEQAKYYELARKERQLHMQLYPGWSARDNYVSTFFTPTALSSHVFSPCHTSHIMRHRELWEHTVS